MEAATPADLAQEQLNAEIAHMKALRRDIKRALFYSTNYTWNDFLINNVALAFDSVTRTQATRCA